VSGWACDFYEQIRTSSVILLNGLPTRYGPLLLRLQRYYCIFNLHSR
jgi:hypothetical protein